MKQTITELRTGALEAYNAALASPQTADWQMVARQLAQTMPKPKTTNVNRNDWAHYAPPSWKARTYQRTDCQVVFNDGQVIRVPNTSDARKPINWGKAIKVAIDYYRARMTAGQNPMLPYDHLAVPQIRSCQTMDGRFRVDPCTANLRSAEWRAANPQTVRRRRNDARLAAEHRAAVRQRLTVALEGV